MPKIRPAYIDAFKCSKLAKKSTIAQKMLTDCRLCPRECRVNRLNGEAGLCQTSRDAVVASYQAHFGEEAPLVGQDGSGTIFFSHCNLLCNFCQNYNISHEGAGQPVDATQLAWMMLQLQKAGCHNINFVTPSHVVPQILAALEIAIPQGLSVPLIYNSSGYDRVKTLRLLDGIFDIYMPDFKFWDTEVARKICAAPDYPRVARRAILEMQRQVGGLKMGASGLATRGLLIRHLVLPRGLAGTREVADFVACKISKATYVNIMGQYRPHGKAGAIRELSKPLTDEEFKAAVAAAIGEGLTRLDQLQRIFMMI
jgi:putative pyruvate formate lyase activating enzyme